MLTSWLKIDKNVTMKKEGAFFFKYFRFFLSFSYNYVLYLLIENWKQIKYLSLISKAEVRFQPDQTFYRPGVERCILRQLFVWLRQSCPFSSLDSCQIKRNESRSNNIKKRGGRKVQKRGLLTNSHLLFTKSLGRNWGYKENSSGTIESKRGILKQLEFQPQCSELWVTSEKLTGILPVDIKCSNTGRPLNSRTPYLRGFFQWH